jgi:hypothetical protein
MGRQQDAHPDKIHERHAAEIHEEHSRPPALQPVQLGDTSRPCA